MPQIMLEYACAHDMIFDVCLPIRFIDTRVFACARHLASSYVLVGLLSDNSGPACQISELETYGFSLLLTRVAWRMHELLVDCLESFLIAPSTRL